MPVPAELQQRIDAYVKRVRSFIANKPAAAREEVINGLREHIHEALNRAGPSPSLADLEKIIGEMDPPESYAEADPSADPPRTHATTARASSNRWFALGLAFLALNGYGVWKFTRMPAATNNAAAIEQTDANTGQAPAPLRLISIEQTDMSATREASLLLHFNATPDMNMIYRFVRLSSPSSGEISYQAQSSVGSNSVMIQTAPVYDEKITCQVFTGLPATTNATPTDSDFVNEIALQMNMVLRRVEASSPSFEPSFIRVMFSASPDMRDLNKFVDVEPDIKFTVEPGYWWMPEVIVRGDFKPGRVYSVTLKEGLAAANGSSLAQTIKRSVQIPNRSAAVQIESPGRILSPQGALTVPIASVNLSSWTAALSPVFRNNLVELTRRERHWLYSYGGVTEDLTGTPLIFTNHFTMEMNAIQTKHLHVRDLSTEPLRGAYWLQIYTDKAAAEPRLMVITDLGLAVRAFDGGLLTWVNSISNASPVAQARITVFAKNNQPIGEGLSDERGLLQVSLPENSEPYLVVAEKDNDISLLCLEQMPVAQGEGLGGPEFLPPEGTEAAVFTERGVYRPGETVFMQALVRDATMKAPAAFPALFRIIRPDGRTFHDAPVMLNEFGSAHTVVVMPDFLPTGRYTIQLAMPGTFTSLGQTEIALEDFVPPQIRVDVASSTPRTNVSDNIHFDVQAMHLFGRAAGGLRVNGFTTVKAVPFAPTNWSGWKFGDDEKAFASIFSALGSQTLDAEGRARFHVEISHAWNPPASLAIVQEAVVMENGGRSVTGYGFTTLDPYPFYIGVRPDWEGIVRVGETQHVSIVDVAPDGAAFADARAHVIELHRATWNSVLRQNSMGRYTWDSERELTLVKEDTFNPGDTPRDWSFAVDAPGDYVLVVRYPASGAATRIAFSAASPGQDWIEWSREKPGHIELQPDKERYHAGETARVMVKAPFSGNALLTIESDRVRTSRLVTLEKNTAEIDVPIASDYFPNVYCTLTLLRPARAESVWSTHRAIGAVALSVSRPADALRVHVDAPATIQPQSSFETTVTVVDSDGNPATGEVTLMAVDEGICLLTEYETPDPNSIFSAQRRLAVNAFDVYSELMRIIDDEIEGASAAGGDMETGIRRRLNPIKANRFKPTALWHAPVKLDAQGAARIRLDVPEFTGALRLMAVAVNATQAGSVQSSVTVKRDVVAQSSLPRFLAPGDRSDASLFLLNESAHAQDIRVVVTSGGPLRVETPEFTASLIAGASTNIVIPLVAGPGIGKAHCRIEVQAGVSSYAETIELAVRPASGLRVASNSQAIEPGQTLTITAPTDWIPETIRFAGAVSARSSLKIARALDYVVQYPYGCLEQTVSGAFPLLYAPAWLATLPASATAVGDHGYIVSNAIIRVISMQLYDGGFGLWPFERQSDVYASLYGIHFLIEAQLAGYAVPDDALKNAMNWLRVRLDRSTITDADTPVWQNDMGERAWIAHVLALAGKPDAGWNSRLQEISPRLNFSAQAHVASALLRSGEPRAAVALMNSLGLPAPRERNAAVFFDSDIRDAALLMSAWMDVEPAHPSVLPLSYYIESRMQDGHWGNTHDNAMALLALGKQNARIRPEAKEYTGMITLPGGTQAALTHAEEYRWDAEYAGGAITISNAGPGTMFVWSRMEGVGTGTEAAAENGVSIRRETLSMNGEPLDATELNRGDMVIVRLTLDTLGRSLDQLVIEDLLPAGWEIENPMLATSQQFPWATERDDASRYREARDDRMLIFTGAFNGAREYYYAARAVTAGTFAQPAVTASGMYEPEIRAVSGGGVIRVAP